MSEFETNDDIVARAWRGEASTDELCEEIKALRAQVKKEHITFRRSLDPDNEPGFIGLWVEQNQENDRLREEVRTLDIVATSVSAARDSVVRDNEALRTTLKKILRAWDSLPGGQSYGPPAIQNWLVKEMTPAIKAARDE